MHPESSTIKHGQLDAGALGVLEIAWDATGITEIAFVDRSNAADEVDGKIATRLRAYLAGDRGEDPCVLPVAYRQGTTKQRRVWDALRTIPFGEVRSYRWLAREVRSIPRAVGRANGANPIPIVVPCHRIINADGTLGGFSSGLERKAFLLRLEGLTVEEPVTPTSRVSRGQMLLG